MSRDYQMVMSKGSGVIGFISLKDHFGCCVN